MKNKKDRTMLRERREEKNETRGRKKDGEEKIKRER